MLCRQSRYRWIGMIIGMVGILTWNPEFFSRSAVTAPIRVGDVARALSDSDVANLQRSLPDGKRPWLLIGNPGQSGTFQFIEAYLPPETSNPNVRRGSMITLHRSKTAPVWIIDTIYKLQGGPGKVENGGYAQVAISGRNFEKILGDDDSLLPFRISGSIEDAELVTLLAFIRSRQFERIPKAAATHIEAIAAIGQKGKDSIQVLFRAREDSELKSVTLRRQGQGWETIAEVRTVLK